MELVNQLLDFVLHIDQHLKEMVGTYHTLVYAILALILFCETGLVFTPFLPGDSLLFAAGALAASHVGLEMHVLLPVLFLAAVAGDSTNYLIGSTVGNRLVTAKKPIIRKDYLDKTRLFYEKHGGKTVVLARFMPILRTFAPFVAGLGSMVYKRFLTFSVVGNLLWILLFCFAGFLFGNIPWVQANFSKVVLGIILVSLLPLFIAFIREKFKK